jgi:hypothetical protein
MAPEDYRLRLTSKRLISGRFQVNFSTEGFDEGYYGYLLAEPKTSVSEVVEKISRHLEAFDQTDKYFQPNLFSLGRRKPNSEKIMIFKRPIAHG